MRRAVEERLAADRQEREARRPALERQVDALLTALDDSHSSEAVCISVDLDGAARRPIGTVCDPKDESNKRCTDLLCLRGKMIDTGPVPLGGGLARGFPITFIEGDVSHWRRDRWQQKACHVRIDVSGSMHVGSGGVRLQAASDAEITRQVDAELKKCLRKIRQASP
jgi:hypothetical protein